MSSRMSFWSSKIDGVKATFSSGHLSVAGQGIKALPNFESAKQYRVCEETRSLDVHSNALSDLKGIESFLQLESFVADYNFLTEDAFASQDVQIAFAGLETLWLNGNRIGHLERLLQFLRPLRRLGSLSLLRNPAVPPKDSPEAFKQYRRCVIYHLEQLHTLDGKLITESERRESRNSFSLDALLVSPRPPALPSGSAFVSKAGDNTSQAAQAKFLVLKEGNVGLLRVDASTTSPVAPESLETFWFILNERQLQWYPDWKAIAPLDIIYLRRQYQLRTPNSDDSLARALQKPGKAVYKLVNNDDKDTLYLVFDADVATAWEVAIKEQTGQKRVNLADIAMSDFTRMQEERRQYLQDEEDKRFMELQRRIAALPIEHVDPQEVKFVRILGMGSFGTVYHATYRDKTVAAKILHEHDADSHILEEFVNEVEMLVKCRDPNVLMLWGVCFSPKMIFMELLRSNLTVFWSKRGRKVPSLLTRLRIARDGATAVQFLHSLQPMIIHRDIKPQNFLVDDNHRVVVADFGLSETLKRGRATWDERGAFRGTIAYCAPEVLKGDVFDEKSDVYGYALVMWALYTCEEPWVSVFPAGDYAEFTRKVLFENMRPALPASMPQRLSALITNCWDAESSKRPSFNEIVAQLDLIMLDVALGSETSLGRAFWERHFGSRHQVDFDEFMGYASRIIPVKNETEEALLKFLFTHTNNDNSSPMVSLERYGRMIRWFGPFTGSASDTVMKRIVGTTKNRWFHGFINMSLAVSLLAEQPIGTFLVRFCNSRHRGHFFILYVHALNDIRFVRVIRKAVGIKSPPQNDTSYVLDGHDEFAPASSLPELVSRLQKGGANGLPKLERAAPGWPFAQIFLHIESPDLHRDN